MREPGRQTAKPKSGITLALLRRHQLGWSQIKAAGISNVTLTVMQRLERGDHEKLLNLSLRSVCKVAMAYNCAPTDLLPFLGKRPRKRDILQSMAMKDAAKKRMKTGSWRKDGSEEPGYVHKNQNSPREE